ncbi:helix-turn-helix domain-containing protein [Desulforamulus aeronauticus]|uniref:DNA-binding transcriptional regulator, XRE-family HTH domain n=1 Tax=Desulforamulus aeronauticus DSM 10349 TaxID=1121421 RepID=A0A1M6WDU0_9FIRM|nr:helix-turn-helix transcriptional regulator [Desulforamulus aeronauticus]SHK91973.1 DNA-binding transcriptional regulator, XRE-family HTH domain [Desulforamulus aeronauticus DSM 10349]
MSKFPEILKGLRELRGLSQKELGSFLNLSKSTISLYESGKREPDYITLDKIANFFGVTTDLLLGRTEDTRIIVTMPPAVSPENLAFWEKIKNLPPEKRKAIEILLGADDQAAAAEGK